MISGFKYFVYDFVNEIIIDNNQLMLTKVTFDYKLKNNEKLKFVLFNHSKLEVSRGQLPRCITKNSFNQKYNTIQYNTMN